MRVNRDGFYEGLDRVVEWSTDLFVKGVSPVEIGKLNYLELKYWAGINKLYLEAKKAAYEVD